MRITSFPIEESEIRFDFSAASSCDKHDETYKVFDGVDFIVSETGQEIWLEVKNFEKMSLPSKMRGGARKKFLAKMKIRRRSKEEYDFYRDELRAKFVGTAASFWLTNRPINKPIVYVMLLASPRLDSAMKLHATKRMKELIPPNGSHSMPWQTFASSQSLLPTVTVAVVDTSDWNALFTNYPANQL